MARAERIEQAGRRSPWMTTAEAAAYVKLSVEHFRDKVLAGEIPPRGSTGGRHRFHIDDLDAWIESGAAT